MMIVMAKIHLATSNGTLGWTWLDHLLKASRFTAVKASAAYTAQETRVRIQSQAYEKGVKHDDDLKSERF